MTTNQFTLVDKSNTTCKQATSENKLFDSPIKHLTSKASPEGMCSADTASGSSNVRIAKETKFIIED
jgi:hypothetical protein